jgi:guanylate kinase
MQNLFLVDGASGVGKSDLLRWAMDNNAGNITYVRKTTTREQRAYEQSDRDIYLDLDFVGEREFSMYNFKYVYKYGGARYGFLPNAFLNAVMTYDNVIAIVRSTTLIQRICDDFSLINTVPMFIYTDRAELSSRLKRKHFSDEEIAFRLARSEIALRDYYAHPEFYREVIINNSSQDEFHRTIDRIIGKYALMPRVDPYSIPVMMSYNPSNKKLDDYYDAIEAAVRHVSKMLRCRKLDKTLGRLRLHLNSGPLLLLELVV